MVRRVIGAAAIMLMGASLLPADFSYQETSTVTGGALAGMMKVMGVFSKSMREPVRSTVYVKGDRMAHRSENSATVIDLNQQTITSIDFQKKTYSVMTFDQMRQALEEAARKAKKDQNAELDFKVSVDNTGKTQQINGFDAKELILKMEMQGTDKKSGDSGSLFITSDMWIAPLGAGYAEVRDFQRRMAEKIAWSPSSGMFASQPEIAKGMAGMAKELAKLDGVPIVQITAMSGAPQPAGAAPNTAAESKPAEPEEKQAERPGIGGALGRLGGLGGFGRRKTEPKSEPQQEKSAAAPGSLIEMRTELSNFSTNAVDDSQFGVPAGFKKVDTKLQ